MKFTKEEAADELKRQLKSIVGDPAINDKAIAETVATLLPMLADDDTELSEFSAKILPVLKTGDGNARKYASNAVKKREREIDAQKPQEEPKPQAESPEQEDPYRKLMERIEALENEKRESDRKAAAAEKRALISKAVEAKGVKDKEWIDGLLAEVSVAEDADVESVADKYVKLYNRGKAHTPADVSPGRPESPSGGESPFGDVAKRRKARQEAEARGNVTVN